MELKRFTEESLRVFARHLAQLKEHFRALVDNVDWLTQPNCTMPGVEVTLLDVGDVIRIAYAGYEVELRLTAAHDGTTIVGRVTAVLVKHPLDASKPVLTTFKLTRDGETDLISFDPNGDSEYRHVALMLVLNLVEAAVLHEPAATAPRP